MATRDRTQLFLQYRQSYGGQSATKSALMGNISNSSRDPFSDEATLLSKKDKQDVAIEMTALPPRWLDIVDQIEEDIDHLRTKIQFVENMHKKSILPSFDDTGKEQQEIEDTTHEITLAFQSIQKKIKKIQQERMSASSGGTSEDVVMAKNVTVSLAAKLQELSTRFRQSQQSYLEKIRRSQTTGNEVFGVPVVSSGVGGSSSNPMEMQYELGFNEQQLKMINTNEAAIEQRSHEINEIAKSIFQLAEVFRDLQTMIIDQGTLLDRIDYNIEDMAKNVKTAHEELVQGEKYQKKASTKMRAICLMVLGVLVVVLIISLIAKQALRN